uniref:DUF305 domain-containing protein n=1 Tax=Oscillatoriales cyanobacterium SpSt-402 TaxID=2282168 RepID=A0A832M3N8_9CYAN
MNTKPLIFGLLGALTGGIITALFIGANSSAPLPTASSDSSASGLITQALPVNSIVQVFPGRGMGRADQRFIEMMIPHHEDAIAMAEIALKRAKHPEIRQLAQSIKTNQTQENQQMRSWYKQWFDADIPTSSSVTGQTGRMGMGRGRGMMNRVRMGCMRTDLAALETAPDFDRAFIEEMVPHHQMAVMMTHMISDSQRPEMRALAETIVKTQTAEINQMQQWYQAWYR